VAFSTLLNLKNGTSVSTTKSECMKQKQWIYKLVIVSGCGLSCILAILLGFIIPSKAQMIVWFHSTGYYFIFTGFLLWVTSLLPRRFYGDIWRRRFQKHGRVLLLALVIIGATWLVTPPRFRILADETNLASTSASMYRHKAFYNSTQGLVYYETYHDKQHVWDIRALFYPFLVSLVHAVSGYRAENAFVVNAIAGFFCLISFYILLQRWFVQWISVIGMLLLSSFPLFVLWTTSGGYEIVNLLFIIITFILLDKLIKDKEGITIEQLGLTLLLLTQLRHESFTITISVGIAVMSLIRQIKIESLSYRSIILPLLFLPIAWQRWIIFNTRDLQLSQGQQIFSFDEFKSNLGNAWLYFTTQPEKHNTIPILFYLALIGFTYGILQVVRHRERITRQLITLSGTTLLCVLLLLVVLLSFNNQVGGFIHPATIRYGIAFLPLIVLGTIILLNGLYQYKPEIARYVWVGVIACLIWHWPFAANNESLRHLTLYREYKVTLDFLKRNYSHSDIVIIAERPGLYTPHFWGAVSFSYANMHLDELTKPLNQHLFQDVLAIQKIQYINHQPTASTQLANVKLETLYEVQIKGQWYLRFSKLSLK
jgi:hypothetical protein